MNRFKLGAILADVAAKQKARVKSMPTEAEALSALFEAIQRLKELGFRDAIDFPKDGPTCDAVSVDTLEIHHCYYQKGTYFMDDGSDRWPVTPILYRPIKEDE